MAVANLSAENDLLDDIARLRSLSVPAPPAWAETLDGLPKVVAALDVAWGKRIADECTGEEEEVAVACCAGFDVQNLAAPLFVEFEPQQGFLRGPFPPYEAGKLFSREGPRLLVPLMKRVIEAGSAREEGGGAKDNEEENVEARPPRLSPPLPLVPKVDLFLVDGFGELHPECFGCACALGVEAGGAPTAGVAKNMLLLGGGKSPSEKEARNSGGGVRRGGGFPCPSSPGMETWPLGDDGAGNPLAVAMRPAGRSGGGGRAGRAAFVSAGHGVSLSAAARAVLACCYDPRRRFRLPEPSRAADRLARERLREELGKARS